MYSLHEVIKEREQTRVVLASRVTQHTENQINSIITTSAFVLNLVASCLISEAIRAPPNIYRLYFEFPNR